MSPEKHPVQAACPFDGHQPAGVAVTSEYAPLRFTSPADINAAAASVVKAANKLSAAAGAP